MTEDKAMFYRGVTAILENRKINIFSFTTVIELLVNNSIAGNPVWIEDPNFLLGFCLFTVEPILK